MGKFNRLNLPEYDQLPKIKELDLAYSWDVYGENDEYGTLNNLDDNEVLAAMVQVKSGERIGLTLPVNAITPPLYGRQPFNHTLIQDSRNTWDDNSSSSGSRPSMDMRCFNCAAGTPIFNRRKYFAYCGSF